MKLASLVAQNFRGFGRRQPFLLGDVNIFGGPNGFGKTSFFDSVLWCLFGSVPRLSGTRDFVQAGDVYQNKFSSLPYSVEVTIDTDDGALIIKRTSSGVVATICDAKIGEADFLKRFELERDGTSRFLRNFLLQQETINDFVRDLNPRGRYDSLISMLEFQTPTRLLARIEELTNPVAVASSQTSQKLAVVEQQVFSLRGDLEKLKELQKDISQEVAEQRYQDIIRGAVDDFVSLTAMSPEVKEPLQLRERVMTLVTRTSDTLRTLREIARQLHELKSLQTKNLLAQTQENLKSQLDRSLLNIAEIQRTLSATKDNLASCENEMAIRKARFDTASEAQGELRAALAAVRALVDSDVCPVCMRPIERATLLDTIDKQMGTIGIILVTAMRDMNEQEALRQKLQSEAQNFRAQLEQHEEKVEELRRILEDRRRFDSLLESLRSSVFVEQWHLFSEDLESFLSAVDRMQTRVEALNTEAVELSAAIDKLSKTALIPRKEEELKKAMDEVDRLRSVSTYWNKSGTALNKCKEAISKAQINLLTVILESHKPLIRSLYKRMHPHPLFTDLDFEVIRAYEKGELYFKVFSPERKVSAYPSTVFSLSQLNVLAVSVFLALNLRIESPLPIVMLDDPIHSMDDLNVLGFCDVVRQLRAKRQLFISTHNKELYGLLLSKFRPIRPDESVKGFWFADWSEEGPTIIEENPSFMASEVAWSEINELVGSPSN